MGFARLLILSMNSMGWTGGRRKGQDTMPKGRGIEWLK